MDFNPQTEMINRMREQVFASRIQPGQRLSDWQDAARAKLVSLLGCNLNRVNSDVRVEWTREECDFVETRFVFRSEKDVYIPCHMLLPKRAENEKLPLMLCLQGHSTGMHISLGRAKFEVDAEDIAGDRDFARQAVRRGYAALAVEQRGLGECAGPSNNAGCNQLTMQAFLLGRTLIGQRVWDMSRAIDATGELFPMIDMDRVAVMGNSGGGTTSIYLAAVDTRVKAAMPSCALCGYMQSIGTLKHCACNYVPGIMLDFDMGDLLGIIAPRPLVIVSGQNDSIFPLASAREQYMIASERYYALADAKEKIHHVIGAGGHRFYAEEGWKTFDELVQWV